MPAAAGRLTAWRRSVAVVIVAAFVLITAYGLCNTYGDRVLHRIGSPDPDRPSASSTPGPGSSDRR
jgi:hypothetical protein